MPALDPEYHKRRRAALKAQWLRDNGPCRRCGSWADLEVDHIDPATKSFVVTFYEGQARREAELAKCQVLCHPCHLDKSAEEAHVDSCPRDHPYTEENTIWKNGSPACRICQRERNREWMRAYRARN